MSKLRPIGDFGKLFAKLSFDAYMSRDPAAVLIQDVKSASFQLSTDDTDATVEFLLAVGKNPDETKGSDLRRVQRDLAYMVAILRAPSKPADERMLIGSSASCDILMPEESVSREHAWIQRQGDEYFIEDAHSTNGTWVESTCLLPGKQHKLTPGDRVTLGNTELIFLDPAGFYTFVKRLLRI